VALIARKPLHENMTGMSIRLSEGYGALRCFPVVTFPACRPGFFTSVFLFYIGSAANVGKEKLIPLENRYLMAGLTFKEVVLAPLP